MKNPEDNRSGPDRVGSSVAQGPSPAEVDETDLSTDLRMGPRYERWKDEVAFFDGALEDLVNDPSYKGRYVAVKGRRVIDSDVSDLELARRMARLHPGDVVLIAKVDTRARRVEVSSPEFS